jgi:peroxiredoxin
MNKPTLTEQLAEYKAGFASRVDPARVEMMENATAAVRATGIERTALQVGTPAPDLTLPDATGKPVRLAELWSQGLLVLVFYRGGWCPYCNLELRAWQQQLDALRARGANLVAISAQTPDNSLSTAEKNALAFPVLSDSALAAAEGFGIAYELPPELVKLYGQAGNDLPTLNGNGRWVLPVPATYVIGRDGRILQAHIEADYRRRAEPKEVLDKITF